MRQFCSVVLSVVFASVIATPVYAYTETGNSSVKTTAGGVLTASTSFTVDIVTQGTDTVTTLGFESVTNTFIDSGEAIRVDVSTNLAANRVIIYTDNLGGSASPQACINTGLGIDGGGLVGETDCALTVPLLWSISDVTVDHVFTTGTIGDDEIFITDKAHIASFIPSPDTDNLDDQAFVRCDDGVTVVANTASDGLYPQFFGTPGNNDDLCDAAATTTVLSQELSKNIAVAAFGFTAGGVGTAPDLSTPDSADSITVTSPFYMAMGADFTFAAAQTYSTNTLTVELVTQ